jgi:hypothetical protein
MIQNFTPNHIERGVDFYMSGYVDIFPIRNLYITSQALGNFSSISLSGERGVLKTKSRLEHLMESFYLIKRF